MAAKHPSQVKIETDVEPEAKTKKRSLTVQTVRKWVLDNENTLDTSTWLTFDTSKSVRTIVTSKCSVCIRFEGKLCGRRNLNAAFIVGSTNLRSASFKDHIATDMHAHVMLLHKKSLSNSIVDYSPIAKALSTLDASTQAAVSRMFEITYMMCKEGLAQKNVSIV